MALSISAHRCIAHQQPHDLTTAFMAKAPHQIVKCATAGWKNWKLSAIHRAVASSHVLLVDDASAPPHLMPYVSEHLWQAALDRVPCGRTADRDRGRDQTHANYLCTSITAVEPSEPPSNRYLPAAQNATACTCRAASYGVNGMLLTRCHLCGSLSAKLLIAVVGHQDIGAYRHI